MRSTERTAPPRVVADLLDDCRLKRFLDWGDALSHVERFQIRTALAVDFEGCCAYCGRLCKEEAVSNTRPYSNGCDYVELGTATIDHFRPRNGDMCGRFENPNACECGRGSQINRRDFRHLTFVWLNLQYSCYRCNQLKGNCWPVRSLFGLPVAEGFVDPGDNGLAEKIFVYDIDSGVMMVNEENTSVGDKQLGRNTIDYLNLNSDVSLFPPDHKHHPQSALFNKRVKRESDYTAEDDTADDDILSMPKQRQAAYAAFEAAINRACDDRDRVELFEEVEAGRVPFANFIMACLSANYEIG